MLMGINFSEYMLNKKMVCAEKLLLESRLTVNEIAQKLGYSSIQHFIKIFTEKYVLTPKEYQKEKSNRETDIESKSVIRGQVPCR